LPLTRPIAKGETFRPKKSLGQNFLCDAKIIQEIVRLSGFLPSDAVLEIGPGQGALTLPLSRTVGHVVAVEKDARLFDLLKRKLSILAISNVTLVNHDILSFDLNLHRPRYWPAEGIRLIGNLPYNISSPFLEKLIENRESVSRAVLMFQIEVARRLTASPCTKAYGALTLLVQYHAKTRCLLEVSKEAFYPKPKVDSMVVELDFERPYPRRAEQEDHFRRLVKGAFAHRRKTLQNSLKGAFPSLNREGLAREIKACGIDPNRRAETLNMDEFLSLTALPAIDKGIME